MCVCSVPASRLPLHGQVSTSLTHLLAHAGPDIAHTLWQQAARVYIRCTPGGGGGGGCSQPQLVAPLALPAPHAAGTYSESRLCGTVCHLHCCTAVRSARHYDLLHSPQRMCCGLPAHLQRWTHGDVVLMCLASSQIIYSFIVGASDRAKPVAQSTHLSTVTSRPVTAPIKFVIPTSVSGLGKGWMDAWVSGGCAQN
jgi:hypothetical protein